MAFLAEVGAERDTSEQAKTRWALAYYIGRAPAGAISRIIARAAAPAPVAGPA